MEDEVSTRWAKTLLMAAMALYFTLVIFNNVTDFDSNYQFVRHVLSMDATFPGNHGMWRAIHSPAVHVAFYVGIIAWETANAVLGWWGFVSMLRARRGNEMEFARSKRVGIAALTSGMLLWFIAFMTVGGEWFLMWQSRTWNGEDAAFRLFVCEGIVLVLMMLRD
jgi:predicted small integral membrane protein